MSEIDFTNHEPRKNIPEKLNGMIGIEIKNAGDLIRLGYEIEQEKEKPFKDVMDNFIEDALKFCKTEFEKAPEEYLHDFDLRIKKFRDENL